MTWKVLLLSAGVLAALGSAPAFGAMVQGKTVTMFSGTGPGVVPAYPATVTAASLPLPTKYKSKKSTLVVTTTIEEFCPADNIATVVSVAGFFLEPDPSGVYWIECGNLPSKTVVKQWFLPSEAAGGPVIPPGSTVDMLMSSSNGTGSAGGSNPMTIKVEALK